MGSFPSRSTATSDQDRSTVSFFDGEGYQITRFHSDTSSDQSKPTSEARIVEENSIFEDSSTELITISTSQPAEIQQPFSPSIFLVSDIEESELVSDFDLPSPTLKRMNTEQQLYLQSASIGTSSTPESSRTVTDEDIAQWIEVYQPAKRFKHDTLEQKVDAPSINSIIGTFSSTSVEECFTKSPSTAPPEDS